VVKEGLVVTTGVEEVAVTVGETGERVSVVVSGGVV